MKNSFSLNQRERSGLVDFSLKKSFSLQSVLSELTDVIEIDLLLSLTPLNMSALAY